MISFFWVLFYLKSGYFFWTSQNDCYKRCLSSTDCPWLGCWAITMFLLQNWKPLGCRNHVTSKPNGTATQLSRQLANTSLRAYLTYFCQHHSTVVTLHVTLLQHTQQSWLLTLHLLKGFWCTAATPAHHRRPCPMQHYLPRGALSIQTQVKKL